MKRLELAALKRRLKRVQKHVRSYVQPGRSLADELIAERREEVNRATVKKP
jgi:hypothetical protein